MAMLAANVFSFIMMILMALLRLGIYLMFHFEVTNSLLASILVQMLTYEMDISSTFRWLMFFGVLIVCLLIQGLSKIGKVVFAIFSVLIAGLLAYIFKTYDSRTTQLTVTAISMCVVGLLNYFSCKENWAA